jgi:AcrR family transcriptional regulator
MSNRKKRTYHSETRHAQAAQTKSRILAAARNLFQTEGFEFVTIEKLAQEAQVSAPTIYSLFQSKRGVLRALMDEALPADQYEALVKDAMQENSAKKGFEAAAKIARQMYDAEKEQMNIFRGASVLAPEFKELEREREMRRYKRQEEAVKMRVREKSLAKGLSVSKARDILWALTGRDLYRMLVVEQGWTSEEYEKWLAQLLISTLIGTD